MNTLVNLTPHPIVLHSPIRDSRYWIDTIPPSGLVARVSSTPGARVDVDGIPVPVYGAPMWSPIIIGLPPPIAGTYYIVSAIVAARCPDRPDVVSPGTGPQDEAIRNDAGQIIGVTRLIRATPGLFTRATAMTTLADEHDHNHE